MTETHDARGVLAERALLDLRGDPILVQSADAGTTRTLYLARGETAREWSARDIERHMVYDDAGRLTQRSAHGRLLERTVHGNSGLLFEIVGHSTPGGLDAVRQRDVEGRVEVAERRQLLDLAADPDRSAVAATPDDQLEAAVAHLLGDALTTTTTYEARGLPASRTDPDGTAQTFTYDVRGLLTGVRAEGSTRSATPPTTRRATRCRAPSETASRSSGHTTPSAG